MIFVTNLVFAEKWKVEENFQWLSIGGHDDEVGDTSVQSLGGLVGALLQLLVVGSLLDEVKNGHSQFGVS